MSEFSVDHAQLLVASFCHELSMPVFTSRPLNSSKVNRAVKKNPALFGVPFVLLMVAASYGLTTFTQTRYDLHDSKIKQVFRHYFSVWNSFSKYLNIGHERAGTRAGQEPEKVRYTRGVFREFSFRYLVAIVILIIGISGWVLQRKKIGNLNAFRDRKACPSGVFHLQNRHLRSLNVWHTFSNYDYLNPSIISRIRTSILGFSQAFMGTTIASQIRPL